MNGNCSEAAFRDAMRCMISTVTVISAAGDGRRQAMTATSVGSLSLAPPSIYISVNRETGLHDLLSRRAPFCLNILSAPQRAIAEACSQPPTGDARFTLDDWDTRDDGTPWLTRAVANLFCTVKAHLDFGTHTLFVGQVDDVRRTPADVLLYGRGDYVEQADRGEGRGPGTI